MAFKQQARAMAAARRRAQGHFAPENMMQANRSTFDVPPEEMALANHYFDTLDSRNMGFIPPKVLVVFFRRSGLPVEALAGIWCVFTLLLLVVQWDLLIQNVAYVLALE